MFRVVSILSLTAALTVATARSATFKLPEDKPVISLVIPDSWKPEKIQKGVQCQTADDAIYFAAEITKSEEGMNSIIDEMFKMLKEQKVSLDRGSRKENKYQFNGLAADELSYDGQAPDGLADVKITFLPIDKDTVLVLTYWASVNLAKSHEKEVKAMMESIKKAK